MLPLELQLHLGEVAELVESGELAEPEKSQWPRGWTRKSVELPARRVHVCIGRTQAVRGTGELVAWRSGNLDHGPAQSMAGRM